MSQRPEMRSRKSQRNLDDHLVSGLQICVPQPGPEPAEQSSIVILGKSRESARLAANN